MEKDLYKFKLYAYLAAVINLRIENYHVKRKIYTGIRYAEHPRTLALVLFVDGNRVG